MTRDLFLLELVIRRTKLVLGASLRGNEVLLRVHASTVYRSPEVWQIHRALACH